MLLRGPIGILLSITCIGGVAMAQKTGSISGVILEAGSHRPIVEAHVILTSNGLSQIKPVDAEGRYTFDAVPLGTYQLSVKVFEHSDVKTAVLTTNAQRLAVDFEIIPPSLLSGRVTDKNGHYLQRARVALIESEIRFGKPWYVVRRFTTSDRFGRYQFSNLSPGHLYWIYAYSVSQPNSDQELGGQTVKGSFYPFGDDISSVSPISLVAGQQLNTADIVLPSAKGYCVSTITEVRDAQRMPIRIALLSAGVGDGPAAFAVSRRGQEDKSGHGMMCNVPSGDYRLIAFQTDEIVSDKTFYATVPLIVEDRNPDPVIIEQRSRLAITGRIVSDSPTTAHLNMHVIVDLVNQSGVAISGIDGPNAKSVSVPGNFEFEHLTERVYRLSVSQLEAGWYVKSASYNGQDLLQTPLDLGATQPSAELLIELANDAGSIEVTVLNKDAIPCPDVVVSLVPKETTIPPLSFEGVISGVTDKAGIYKSPALAPDKYFVLTTLTPIEHNQAGIEVLQKLLSSTEVTELNRGQTVPIQVKLVAESSH